jgi:hypothetical protein
MDNMRYEPFECYQIKTKFYRNDKKWEDIEPTYFWASTSNWNDALDEYIKRMEQENIDLSKVWEYRVNYLGSPQGHYHNIGFQKVLSGEWE